MKESYNEDIAGHIGPESCASTGNSKGEALTGERAGRVLSPEITGHNPGADVLQERRRQHREYRHGKIFMDSAGSETSSMYGNTLYGNRDTLYLSAAGGSHEESTIGVRS